LDAFFVHIDRNKDGRISYAEFVDWIYEKCGRYAVDDLGRTGLVGGTTTKELRKDSKAWINNTAIDKYLSEELRIICALDGSDCSNFCFEYVVKELMQQDRNSILTAMHVYDDSKTELPLKFRKSAVVSYAESMCTSNLRGKRFHVTTEMRRPGEPIGVKLVSEIGFRKAHFVCLGFSGRKGKTARKKAFHSNVMEVIQRGDCSTIVHQDVQPKVHLRRHERAVKFVVSVSLNAASTKAWIDALRLSKPGDEIHVVYVVNREGETPRSIFEEKTNMEASALLSKYTGFFAGLKDSSEDRVLSKLGERVTSFNLVPKGKSQSIAETVTSYAEKVAADFVIVGTNVLRRAERGKPVLGSVSLEICLNCHCNFVVSNYNE